MPTTPVLLNVDDNEPARYARTRILQEAGFVVHEAADGHAGLSAVGAQRPHLVLLDVHLPDMNGMDVCKRLRANPENASVMILQISATADATPQAVASLNCGADAYLAEPVEAEVLVATVRAMLRLRTAERDLATANLALREANLRLYSLNQDFERSNEDLKQFASVASHDLQEPLRTVTTYLQMLTRSLGTKLTEAESEYLKAAVEGAARMRQLILDLLAYSRVGRDSDVILQPVDLNEVREWVEKNLQNRIEESNAVIESEPLPSVQGDFVQLAQVFQNLIENALKYREAGSAPVIRISAEQSAPGEWRIGFQDNGVGIEPEYHERVFVPFKRLHGHEVPGTGIGLALCRRIVETMGGRIWVESDGERGSLFRFTVPAGKG